MLEDNLVVVQVIVGVPSEEIEEISGTTESIVYIKLPVDELPATSQALA